MSRATEAVLAFLAARPGLRRAMPPRSAPPKAPRDRPRVIVRTLLGFALPGLIVVIVIGIGAVGVFQNRGENEAIRDARQLTRAIGLGLVEPRLTDGVVRGGRPDVERLDSFVRARVLTLDSSIERIKIWSPDGRIVYSDEPRLIGSVYPLGADEVEGLESNEVSAELSDLSGPENRFERASGELLEVYLPLQTPSEGRVLFEVYLRYSSVVADARTIWLAFAPALLAALVLLWLVQLPLAWSFGRRLQRGQIEREHLLVKAMQASEAERRRIAGDLHDGVVQDLAGLSMSISAAAERADDPQLRRTLEEASTRTRQSIRQMRSLLVDIYPANLHSAGLQSALADLLAPLAARGVRTDAVVDPDLQPSPEVEQLVFRTAQEALRNVLQHARATSVELRATLTGDMVGLHIEDDGAGFAPEEAQRARTEGHFGLALLGDRAADLGGRLVIDSAPGRGTRVHLEVPAR